MTPDQRRARTRNSLASVEDLISRADAVPGGGAVELQFFPRHAPQVFLACLLACVVSVVARGFRMYLRWSLSRDKA